MVVICEVAANNANAVTDNHTNVQEDTPLIVIPASPPEEKTSRRRRRDERPREHSMKVPCASQSGVGASLTSPSERPHRKPREHIMKVPCASQPGVGAILTPPSEQPQHDEPILIQEDEDPNQTIISQLVSE